jgi:hypothetical protein
VRSRKSGALGKLTELGLPMAGGRLLNRYQCVSRPSIACWEIPRSGSSDGCPLCGANRDGECIAVWLTRMCLTSRLWLTLWLTGRLSGLTATAMPGFMRGLHAKEVPITSAGISAPPYVSKAFDPQQLLRDQHVAWS